MAATERIGSGKQATGNGSENAASSKATTACVVLVPAPRKQESEQHEIQRSSKKGTKRKHQKQKRPDGQDR